MNRVTFALAALAFALTGGAHSAEAAAAPTSPAEGAWTFTALLDGEPIGQHRFSVSARGDERTVVSEADFAVKVFGITAYRYRHKATEQWRGDCLDELASTTDDDGKPSSVRMRRDAAASIDDAAAPAAGAASSITGCVMSFAYWNVAIRTQTRLLNAQTGKLEQVDVRRVGSGRIEVRGKPVEAQEFRIVGAAQPINVWYSKQGEWLGLDSMVAGGRRLSYRLK